MFKRAVILIFLSLGINTIALAQDSKVFITQSRNTDNSLEFKYLKNAIGHYIVEIELENVANIDTRSVANKVFNYNLNSDSGLLFRLSPEDKTRQSQCSYSYTSKLGTLEPKIDDHIIYLLPFKKGKKVNIYTLTRFDRSPETWKNYAYYSKSKDTIYAMRKGLVVDIRKVASGTLIENEKTGINYRTEVVVEHADGTNASYTGLDENTLKVKIGQTIYPQQAIGTMDSFTDSGKNYNFKFNIYYYSDQLTGNVQGMKPMVIEKSVMSNFVTELGIQKLSDQTCYIVKYSEDILFQEMTKEEKDQYLNTSSVL